MPPRRIHNAKQRMPTILAYENFEAWLEGSADDAHAALKPYPAELMAAWPVSARVNSPKNNDAKLLRRSLRKSIPAQEPRSSFPTELQALSRVTFP